MNKSNLLILSCVLFVLMLISLTGSVQYSSPLRQFNITQDVIYLNWTNDYAANITIGNNGTLATWGNIIVEIVNSTSDVSANYSQGNIGRSWCQGYHLFVKNVTGDFNNTIGSVDLNQTRDATITDNIKIGTVSNNHIGCSPGRYWINQFTLRNSTQTNETANITVFIDIPISTSNNGDILTTGVGTFGGDGASMPLNATTYHSYYLNTSLVPNATGVRINITWSSSSQDIDLFLFDNSSTPVLKAKSVNKSATNESLIFNFLPVPEQMWEIRVFGNSTSAIAYSGTIVYTTLNATNSSNILVNSLDFGVMNASQRKQMNFTLKNEGNLILTNIRESVELYLVKRFNGNDARNHTFIVPNSSIVTKVKAVMNWTGDSNYTLNVFNQDDTLVATSTDRFVYANKTSAIQEEYNETSSVSAGLWKVQVVNNTNATNPYNVTVYLYVSPSNWISSNYSIMTFNRTGNDNYTYDVGVNLTVQNDTFDGSYEGYVQYSDGNNAGIRIPISLTVTTPTLIVNNTLSSMTVTLDENYGTDLTRTVFISVNNTGSDNLILSIVNTSNSTLTCVSGGCNSSYFANFTYNSTGSIGSQSSEIIAINIMFNSSMLAGVYSGSILFNATNSTTEWEPHPYESFELTFRLNLTNRLEIRAVGIKSVDGDTVVMNNSVNENVTVKFKIFYVNGTEIEAGNTLNTSNFTIWLTETNITSYRIPPSSGSLDLFNGTNPIYLGNDYEVNFTVPLNRSGGTYKVHVQADYNKNPSLTGESINQTLTINNTGLYMTTPNSTSFNMANGSVTKTFVVNVTNYGTKTASSAIIRFSESCSLSVAATSNNGLCGSTSTSEANFTINTPAYASSLCQIWWTITPSTTGETCSATILADNTTNAWFNPRGIDLTITVTTVTTTTTATTTTLSSENGGSGTSGDGTATTTTIQLEYLNISSYPFTVSVEQGGNKTESVKVKNINETVDQSVKLEIFGIEEEDWYEITPSTSVSITTGSEYTYFVSFTIPENTTVDDYSGLFKASSSYGSDKKDFTLKVTPGAEMKEEISLNITQYKSEILSLEEQINQSKKQGYNVSEAETLLSQLKEKMTEVESYVDADDYRSAYDLLDDVKTLIDQTRTALLEANPTLRGGWWGWGKWIIIAAVGVGVAFVGYMFWPTPTGYKPEGKYPEKIEEGEIKDRIRKGFERLKEKLRNLRKKKEQYAYMGRE